MRVARANGIGSLTLVDKQGKFTDDAGEFAGRYVKDYTDDKDVYKRQEVGGIRRSKAKADTVNNLSLIHI